MKAILVNNDKSLSWSEVPDPVISGVLNWSNPGVSGNYMNKGNRSVDNATDRFFALLFNSGQKPS